jgi:hypothetical protein
MHDDDVIGGVKAAVDGDSRGSTIADSLEFSFLRIGWKMPQAKWKNRFKLVCLVNYLVGVDHKILFLVLQGDGALPKAWRANTELRCTMRMHPDLGIKMPSVFSPPHNFTLVIML